MVDATPTIGSSNPSKKSKAFETALVLLGWFSLLYFVLRVARHGSIADDVGSYQRAYLIAFLGYMVLIRPVVQRRNRLQHGRPWWLLGCVILRLIPIFVKPTDDAPRYLWEGRVQRAGLNPYRLAPDDPKLEVLRDENWKKVNHPDYPAIYGPVAELEFRLAAAIRPTTGAIKALHVLWDVLTLLVLYGCLRRTRSDPKLLLIYALCPLTLSAFAIEGHVDSLMLLWLVIGYRFMLSERIVLAGASWGLAAGVKIVVLIYLVQLIRRSRKALAAGLIILAVCYLPFADAGGKLFESLVRFGQSDYFFSLPDMLGITAMGPEVVRWATLLLLPTLMLVMLCRKIDTADYAVAIGGVFLMLAPVVQYWYLTWILVFIPLTLRVRVDRSDVAPCLPFRWLFMAAALVVYFESERRRMVTGTWAMPTWAPVVAWTSFAAGWVMERWFRHATMRPVEG